MNNKTKHSLSELEQFCIDSYLVNGNADMAYSLSRRNETAATEENLHRLALRWLRSPHVGDYIKERRGAVFSQASEVEGRFRDKDSVLSALEAEIPYLKGKDRLDALMKIADLQQLKKDELKTDEQKVQFYLPLKICKDCDKRGNLQRTNSSFNG